MRVVKIPFVGVVSLLLAGCGPDTHSQNDPLIRSSTASTNETSVGAIQGTNDAPAAKPDQRLDAAFSAMNETLTSWATKIGELRKRGEALDDGAKAESGKALATLQDELNQAESTLKDIKSTSGEKWQELKSKFDQTVAKLTSDYETATTRKN